MGRRTTSGGRWLFTSARLFLLRSRFTFFFFFFFFMLLGSSLEFKWPRRVPKNWRNLLRTSSVVYVSTSPLICWYRCMSCDVFFLVKRKSSFWPNFGVLRSEFGFLVDQVKHFQLFWVNMCQNCSVFRSNLGFQLEIFQFLCKFVSFFVKMCQIMVFHIKICQNDDFLVVQIKFFQF